MDGPPSILLTNDDGIESPGLRALYDGLADVGDVTAVAPASDQSAVGRSMSSEVAVRDHELGYAVEGTPSDCVVAGLDALCPDPDVVVSGSNEGANLGMYVLGRSGTVSAAVEAAFFDVPAIATSLYLPQDKFGTGTTYDEHRDAVRATSYLVDHALDTGVFDHADYLNVNAPLPGDDPAPMQVTVPSHAYDMAARHEGETVTLHDQMWERIENGDIDDPEGTDRRAVMDGSVSVSPLTAPHTTERHEILDALAETY
ncbi:MAG: 5'/3'-nucleotidase SurE [Halobacteriaceae archaeon]